MLIDDLFDDDEVPPGEDNSFPDADECDNDEDRETDDDGDND